MTDSVAMQQIYGSQPCQLLGSVAAVRLPHGLLCHKRLRSYFDDTVRSVVLRRWRSTALEHADFISSTVRTRSSFSE
jgi:hypothetical protein